MERLPISYCTNVHPCKVAADVAPLLDQYTLPVRQRCGFDVAAGLWLPATAASEVAADPDKLAALADELRRRDVTCYTLNAFPFGDFHSTRVKENVYLPDWSDPRRLEYTRQCANILVGLIGDRTEGSISTLPLGFKGFEHSAEFEPAAIRQLLAFARDCESLEAATGKCIRLALEPEPFCLFETTAETTAFFARLFAAAARDGMEPVARRYLGVCYDVCHQAVEFEDAGEAIRALQAADIRINKVQVSCAVEMSDPRDPAQREALLQFAEPRYLHQTMARRADGSIARLIDLTESFVRTPSAEFLDARPWRVHFHVPVDAPHLGVLGTTRPELVRALRAIVALPYLPHLEVETYTWPVMPGADPITLVEGLAKEIIATAALLP